METSKIMTMKNISFWEKVLKDMPESYRKWFDEEEKYLNNLITQDSKVLEVGCGNGRVLLKLLNKTKNLIGIDNEAKAVKDAKENFKSYPELKFLLADVRSIPFEDNYFDFVLCIGTFANFYNYKFKALEEMKRVVKNNGFIIISVYSEDAFEERMKLYKKIKTPIQEIKGTTVFFAGEKEGENASEQFSKQELQEIFKKTKLKTLEIKKAGIGYICKLKK
ncbi:MAG TPA: class I SAM-dependent methyltransferase [Candidatus Nanoarchaeia archaeon]|nr:class I SAM-dependent methyltransferase [Candidatus Nanoarchaeia archaeon]